MTVDLICIAHIIAEAVGVTSYSHSVQYMSCVWTLSLAQAKSPTGCGLKKLIGTMDTMKEVALRCDDPKDNRLSGSGILK